MILKEGQRVAGGELQQSFYNTYNHTNQHAKNNHGNNRKIKPEIFSFYPDVSWQMPDPVQLVMKKINDNPYYNDGNSYDDDILSCFWIHKRII